VLLTTLSKDDIMKTHKKRDNKKGKSQRSPPPKGKTSSTPRHKPMKASPMRGITKAAPKVQQKKNISKKMENLEINIVNDRFGRSPVKRPVGEKYRPPVRRDQPPPPKPRYTDRILKP
jgi:hypothetical protein